MAFLVFGPSSYRNVLGGRGVDSSRTLLLPDILLLSLAVFIWFPICFLPIVTHKLLARVRDDDGSDDGSGLLMIVSGRTKQQDDSDRRQSACAC